jgi:hypothetical protein
VSREAAPIAVREVDELLEQATRSAQAPLLLLKVEQAGG